MRARYHRYQENVTHASDPTRSTDSWPNRRLYSSETSRTSAYRHHLAGPVPAAAWNVPSGLVPRNRATGRTVRPSGNRGVTESLSKEVHAASSTTSPDWLLRPIKSSYFTKCSLPSAQAGPTVSAQAAITKVMANTKQTSIVIRINLVSI